MIRFSFSAIVLSLFCLSGNAQNVYLKYDENCMDRLEYASGESNSAYVAYSFSLSEKRHAILDIGPENAKWVQDPPGKITYCANFNVDKTTVRQINDGSLRLYVVRESPTHYQVSAVDKATWYEEYRDAIEFVAADAEFTVYKNNLVSDVNLAQPGSKNEVYLEGTLRNLCTTGYIFTKKESRRSESYKEFVLVPEIGIVERRSISGSSFSGDENRNVLRLHKIKGMDYRDYQVSLCDDIQASIADRGSVAEDVWTAKDPIESPSGYAENEDGFHVVQKSETLYGISKRYGLTVEQLSSLNNLGANTALSIGQKLAVRQGATSTGSKPGDILTDKTGFDAKAAEKGYWLVAPEIHIVKRSESVAQLASLYGYTEARFRKMNNLSGNESIETGQKLFTNDCVCPTLESTTKGKPQPYELVDGKLTPKGGKEDVFFRPVKSHTVKNTDTLFSIAELYQTTVERLMELNGLKKGEAIKPNQRIYVQ